jgi:hypothetical protein
MRLTTEGDLVPDSGHRIGDKPGTRKPGDQAAPLPDESPTITSAPSALEQRVLAELRSRKEPLYALLDAARDPLVLARLLRCDGMYQSLYDGPQAERLADVAPYLVALTPGTPFLETLVREGWGKSWGVYLACDRPLDAVRKHLRRFLTVETEDGKKLLFRFYDPRVLRVFLPNCTSVEVDEFFGPVAEFLMEGETPGSMSVFGRDASATIPMVPDERPWLGCGPPPTTGGAE